jgi:hypothetical protein
MTQDTAPSVTRRGAEIRLEWPGLLVIAFDRADGLEIAQFASEAAVGWAEVEALVKDALLADHTP